MMKYHWIRAIPLLTVAALAFAQPHQAQPPKSVRLYVLDGGSLNIPDTSPYQLKKEDVATTYMSVASFLIAHPKGTLMWDAGAVPDTSFKPGSGSATLRYATATTTLTAQLAGIGYSPSDIKYLSLSHFHWDHVGNSNLFAGSTWLVRQPERDIMFDATPSPRTEPANYSGLKSGKTTI